MRQTSIVQIITSKDIPGYEGLYYATEDGRVFSHTRPIYTKDGVYRYHKKGREVIGEISLHGYRRLLLSKGGKVEKLFAHRCVAKCFHENPENLPFVNHKDGNKLNNAKDNLEWVTAQENTEHAITTGLSTMTPRILDEDTENKIREEYVYMSSEFGVVSLAKKYGVSKSLVHLIINGRNKNDKV